ncbi:MAG: BtrH N-terminal domain-containing protein [Promethearchaeota archaeon]
MVNIIIDNFRHLAGANCQTSSLKKVLAHYGIQISEPMILGLCSGIGFFYFFMKKMPFPMILGLAVKKTEIFERVMNRLGGRIKVTETTSIKIAHDNLIKLLKTGQPAITFVDFAYLPFFFAEGTPIPNEKAGHFGGHTFVTYGIDEETDKAFISDRYARPFVMSYLLLKQARNSKFAPFPAKNKLVELIMPKKSKNLKEIIPAALLKTTKEIKKITETNVEIKELYNKKLLNNTHYSLREIHEIVNKNLYEDIDKIRPVSFQNLVKFTIFLRNCYFDTFKDDKNKNFQNFIQDTTIKEIEAVYEAFSISKRTAYDYLNTLQLLLDYCFT